MGIHLHSTDTPVADDVPIWVTDHWEYQPAAVVTANGIGGDGTVADPLVALTSGEWGSGWLDQFVDLPDTEGKPVYIDTAGMLRSAPDIVLGPRPSSTLPSAYPPGLSFLPLSATDAKGGSWTTESVPVQVLTMNGPNEATQVMFTHRVATPVPYTDLVDFRRGNSSGWKEWVGVYGPDTGWVNMTGIGAGWTVPIDNPVPGARQFGKRVQLRGRIVNSAFGGGGSYTTIATLPTSIGLPKYATLYPWAGNSPQTGGFQITNAGAVQFNRTAASPSHVDFGSITYVTN